MPEFIASLPALYLDWVKAQPLVSAMIQFAILGTLGEVISKWIIQRSFRYPFSFLLTIWKMLVWAALGLAIKYAFQGFCNSAFSWSLSTASWTTWEPER